VRLALSEVYRKIDQHDGTIGPRNGTHGQATLFLEGQDFFERHSVRTLLSVARHLRLGVSHLEGVQWIIRPIGSDRIIQVRW
jgi:hypothetical protein